MALPYVPPPHPGTPLSWPDPDVSVPEEPEQQERWETPKLGVLMGGAPYCWGAGGCPHVLGRGWGPPRRGGAVGADPFPPLPGRHRRSLSAVWQLQVGEWGGPGLPPHSPPPKTLGMLGMWDSLQTHTTHTPPKKPFFHPQAPRLYPPEAPPHPLAHRRPRGPPRPPAPPQLRGSRRPPPCRQRQVLPVGGGPGGAPALLLPSRGLNSGKLAR